MEVGGNRKAKELNANCDALKWDFHIVDLKTSLLQTTSGQSGIYFHFLTHHSKLILIIFTFSSQTLVSARTCLILPIQKL